MDGAPRGTQKKENEEQKREQHKKGSRVSTSGGRGEAAEEERLKGDTEDLGSGLGCSRVRKGKERRASALTWLVIKKNTKAKVKKRVADSR